MSDVKRLPEISREEWIVYCWIDVSNFRDSMPKYIRGPNRTPEEAARAAVEYDTWRESYDKLSGGK